MAIQSSEIVWRHPATRSDTAANGGLVSNAVIPNSSKNAVFPDVSRAERLAGSTKYRKVFIHIANDDDLVLADAKVLLTSQTRGDDMLSLFPATHNGTQSSITGNEQQYGAGLLNATVSAGAVEIGVATESASLAIYDDGMLIRLYDSVSGDEEYVRIDGAPSYVGDVATLTLSTPLSFAYTEVNTVVSSVYEAGDVAGVVSGFAVTTAGNGDYDTENYPVLVDSIGSIYQTWTVAFTSATAFTITGNTLGQVGTGSKSADSSPLNPASSKPYFTLFSAGFTGVYASGDHIVFTTTPPMIPIWYRREVPAGADPIASTSCSVMVDGETA